MIEPLELKTWFVQVFAGTPEILSVLALMIIVSTSAFFKMNAVGMFLMIGVFLLMFQAWLPSPLIYGFAVFGGLFIGYWLQKIFSR